jgi:hypothetical protein
VTGAGLNANSELYDNSPFAHFLGQFDRFVPFYGEKQGKTPDSLFGFDIFVAQAPCFWV